MEINKIKEDFIKVIEYSQGIIEPKVDKLFSTWEDKKSDIIKAFGGSLIYEVPEKITFELSEEGQSDRIQSFIDYCWSMNLEDLGEFVEYQRDGFFKNVCNKDYADIKKGTRLIKAFKHFIEDPKVLNEMQSKASMIIQENKVEGTLCFSVHPLDYLSLSESTYNWRSCHALDGEYRAGNLSYMMDNSTIVCYLRGEDKVKLPRFPDSVPWYSKKWRVLLYLSNDWKMIFAGKQYPFSTRDGMDMIIEKFFNADPKGGYRKPKKDDGYRFVPSYEGAKWSKWSDYKIDKMERDGICFDFDDRYIPLANGLVSLYDLVKNGAGSKQYNDVLYSSCYDPMYTYLTEAGWWNDGRYALARKNNTYFDIGGYTYCLRCGKAEVMNAGEATMMCYDCEKEFGNSTNGCFTFCHHCGRRIETDNAYWMEEEYYCEECFDELGEKCDECNDYYLRENLHYIESEDRYLCDWCYKNRDAQSPKGLAGLYSQITNWMIQLPSEDEVFSFKEEI